MPTVRRRPDAQEKSGEEATREAPRVSMPMPRALGPMREAQPTAEFAPEDLAEALERSRTAEDAVPEAPAPAPRTAMPPRRTRSGERPIVRPPMATPSVDLAREVLVALEPEDPSDVTKKPSEPSLPLVVPAATSESRLGVVASTMEMTPRAPVRTSASPRVRTRTTPGALTPSPLPALTPLDAAIPLTGIATATPPRMKPVGAAVPRLRRPRVVRPGFVVVFLLVLALAAAMARLELHLF